ncbi:MAG: 2-polyprenyl-3-methyl-6-methoxy-1,4-benzoquinone monooxygenase [Gammaproteobacteria bacterium]|nr:2-polyprenyl-3-methyl-6-methoxy-1,4-benzoquinone monooxygenase [Gammaproteobacteria bacterium]
MTIGSESFFDRLIGVFDTGLRTLAREQPKDLEPPESDANLTPDEKKKSAALMRVNHAGEVCAQGLYEGQALVSRVESTRGDLLQAAEDEKRHLHWCEERLGQLEDSTSVLTPILYGLSVCVGAAAGLIGDRISLGFVEATEDQVCKHLDGHLNEISSKDTQSREILEKIREDEMRHGSNALNKGGIEFPRPVKTGMTLVSKLMTETTRHI